jgi:ABC-type nitrate/sulfonate/bicarbonate transport system permease component
MPIAITWPNIYRLTALVLVVLSLLITIGTAAIQWQMKGIDSRLEERLQMYRADQGNMMRRIERLEQKLEN